MGLDFSNLANSMWKRSREDTDVWEDFMDLESNVFLHIPFKFLTNQGRSLWLEFQDVFFRDSRLLLYLKEVSKEGTKMNWESGNILVGTVAPLSTTLGIIVL